MSPADLLVWGIVLHLIADWPLQNEWMAANKAKRRTRIGWAQTENSFTGETFERGVRMRGESRWWWDRHQAAYVHAGIHGMLMLLVFPWWGATAIAVAHFVIDLRTPVVWWSRLIRQTQPDGSALAEMVRVLDPHGKNGSLRRWAAHQPPGFDIGTEVRIWTDQVAHVATIAIVALIAGGVL